MTDDSSLPLSMDPNDSGVMHAAQRPALAAPKPDVVGSLGRATRAAGLPGLASRLEQVRDWMVGDLGELEASLMALIGECKRGSDVSRRAAAHLLSRPGKRIRPLCVMLGAQLADVPIDARVKSLAIACELVHAATLLHDDVIDEGRERRGAEASRMVYGNSASILGGDYLLIEALERVARTGSGVLIESLLDTIAQMVAAEALQLAQRGIFSPDRDAYLKVIEGKTASLFRWALCAAPRLHTNGHGPPVDLALLSQAGTALGMAFQLVDDVLDLDGDHDATGKDLFADLAQGKLTWPLIVASEREPALAERVRMLSSAGHVDPADAAAVVARIAATGAIEATRRLADAQRIVAREALASLPPSRARSAIETVIDAAVDRRK